MAESNARSTLVGITRSLNGFPVENRVGEGTPDFRCVACWIELKWLKAWPRTADIRPVKFNHPLLPSQKRFIQREFAAGGITLVLIVVGRDWMFFDGPYMITAFGTLTRPQMMENAMLHVNTLTKTNKEIIRAFLLSQKCRRKF